MDRNIVVPQGEAGLLFMREFVRRNFRPKKPGEPSFVKGFVGFLTYEGNAHFVYVDEVVNISRGRGEAQDVFFEQRSAAPLQPPRPPSPHLRQGFGGLRRAAVAFGGRSPHAARSASLKMFSENTLRLASPRSNLTYKQYIQKIQRIKEYLYAGDTYQVNFSQKFEVPYAGSAFGLYQKLTQINPSPFQFFMEASGEASGEASEFAVISNSPERLLRLRKQDSSTPPTVGSRGFPTGGGQREGGRIPTERKRRSGELIGETVGFPQIIETRPIKGTMPRGRTPEEDFANTQKLLASEKDRAELAMIVDLERNDIGKLCIPGTVEVTEERTIEKYSHVIHTVANVRGVLADQYDWYDALKALFPGGSVTGCPKKRTMEIIAELEGEPRGVYCGSAGWIDLSGDCDFNIMIRTLWLEKGVVTFRSGGGIIVDSDPQKEYEETLHKAAAIAQAISGGTYGSPISSPRFARTRPPPSGRLRAGTHETHPPATQETNFCRRLKC